MKPAVFFLVVCAVAGTAQAQNAPPAQNRPAARPPANPRDLSGKWLRTTPFQTFSNVKGGANEFQNEITQGRQPDLNRDTGLKYAEPVFTPAGKAAFDRNIPSYGLRITAPKDGNDPDESP